MENNILFELTIDKSTFISNCEHLLFLPDDELQKGMISLFTDIFLPHIDSKYQEGVQYFLEMI